MKVEVDVLGSHTHDSTYSLCGRKATLDEEGGGGRKVSELRNCVKVEVDVLTVPIVSVEVKQHQKKKEEEARSQRPGAVWKSRWTSWAPRP